MSILPGRPTPAGPAPEAPAGVLAGPLRAVTVGALLSVTVVAFNGMGVVTVLPQIALELGGLSLYGWSVSAFTLASILGTVAAGAAADRRGAEAPYVVGLVLFAVGSVVAAAAGSWGMLLAGRALQGAGNGALIVITYFAIARAYPPALHARMLALLSSAWILPSILGPALAGTVADLTTWRLVFLMLLPLLALAAGLAVGPLRRVRGGEGGARRGTLAASLALVAATALLLAGLGTAEVALALPLCLAGLIPMLVAVRRLVPAGTLRARRGVPMAIAARGLLASAFLGVEAFVTLGLVAERGLSATSAGLVMTAGSLSWSGATFLQARGDERDGGAGRLRRLARGFLALAAGTALMGAGVLVEDLTVLVAAAGWALAGLGIGLAYPTSAALVFAATAEGEEGGDSSALQLVETLGISLTTGTFGALTALGLREGWPGALPLALVYGAAVALAVLGAGVVGARARPSSRGARASA